jgi:hypothetical protein
MPFKNNPFEWHFQPNRTILLHGEPQMGTANRKGGLTLAPLRSGGGHVVIRSVVVKAVF